MIIWLSGQSGSGKTTIANYFSHFSNFIILDGDEMRKTISTDLGLTKEDRNEHNLRVARLAKLLSDQGHNICVAVIAPLRETRKHISYICDPLWIYLQRDSEKSGKEYIYERPSIKDHEKCMIIQNDQFDGFEVYSKIIGLL